MSFSLVETGVPGEKPLQAKLRADYFSLPLFLYLQCLKQKELKKRRREGKGRKRRREGKRRKSYQDSLFIEIFLHAVFMIL
jgi:hypothetical protein